MVGCPYCYYSLMFTHLEFAYQATCPNLTKGVEFVVRVQRLASRNLKQDISPVTGKRQ